MIGSKTSSVWELNIKLYKIQAKGASKFELEWSANERSFNELNMGSVLEIKAHSHNVRIAADL